MKDGKNSFIVSGYSCSNYIIRVHELPKVGMTKIVQNKDNSTGYHGGNGINVAAYLSKLGMYSSLIMRGGYDFREKGFEQCLINQDIKLNAVSVLKEDSTPVCYLIENDNNDHMTLFYTGSMDAKYAPSEYPDSYFEDIDWAVMTVASRPDNEAFLKGAKKFNIPIAFVMRPDPVAYPADFLNVVLHEAKLVFMNEIEQVYISNLLGYEPTEELLCRGKADAVIVTHGPEGCIIYRLADGIVQQTHIDATVPDMVVDTTGAGDSFVSGFLYGIVNGCSYEKCAKYGATVSSFIIEAAGCLTSVPTAEQMLERYKTRRTDSE